MKAEQLQAIKERAGKAACGPWEVRNDNEGTEYFPFWVISKDGADSGEWFAEVHVGDVSDAEFIARAREDIPALVAEVERLKKALSIIAYTPIYSSQAEIERYAAQVLEVVK